MLSIHNLTKMYDHNKGIFGFDLDVKPGTITLLLGPNGAGKTTAMRSILHLTESDYDQIIYLNEKFDRKKSLKTIGAMISKPAFYDYLTGFEHLKLMKSYYPITDERIQQVLEQVGLKEHQNNKVKTYSTGMKQRLDFARAIIHNPQLLILDEPFSGLDIEVKYAFKQILMNLKNEGKSILISSHMVGDLSTIADNVVIIYEGKTLFKGPKPEDNHDLEQLYLTEIEAYKKGDKHEYLESRMA